MQSPVDPNLAVGRKFVLRYRRGCRQSARKRLLLFNVRQLLGFGIATVGLVNFFLGNFIFGVILFLVGTAMLPDRG